MPSWSVKTRRAPPRHCRGTRVYGHTTTVMHDMSTHTPLHAHPHYPLPRGRSTPMMVCKFLTLLVLWCTCHHLAPHPPPTAFVDPSWDPQIHYFDGVLEALALRVLRYPHNSLSHIEIRIRTNDVRRAQSRPFSGATTNKMFCWYISLASCTGNNSFG